MLLKDAANTANQSAGGKIKKPSKPLRRDRKTRLKDRLEAKSCLTKFSKEFQKWCRTNNIPLEQEVHLK